MTGFREQLNGYLTDAHSIEEQALAQLRSAPKIAGAERLAAAFRGHLPETQRHERAVARLLESRDETPSWFKDTMMKIGGKGFVLFAWANPDTPGKLLAHGLSYEALEEASYRLLARVAEHLAENDVVEVANTIKDEEIAMQERLAACYDDAVDASLAAVGNDDVLQQLRRYLADAHALELQAIELLERGSSSDAGKLTDAYQEHLAETRDHAEAVEARLRAVGGDPSSLKDTAMRAGGINWTLFLAAHPDTPGKVAAFSYAFEHLEIGGYEQLKRVAVRAGDDATAERVERILEQEREAAGTIRGLLPETALRAIATA